MCVGRYCSGGAPAGHGSADPPRRVRLEDTMSLQEGAGWTYADLSARFPEDHVRRELIRGELFVTPSPDLVHQRVVRESAFALLDYSREHGGEVILSPMDVIFSRPTCCSQTCCSSPPAGSVRSAGPG
jgi:hypothetical protein